MWNFLMRLPDRVMMVWNAVTGFALAMWAIIDTFFSIPLFWDWGMISTYPRFILWIGWIILATQPKPVDVWANKICGALAHPGKYMAMLYRGGIIFKVLTCMIWIPGMLLKSPEFFRFFITIAGANFFVSNWMLSKGGGVIGWIIASMGLVMTIVWWVWLRSSEYRAEFAESIRKKGPVKGVLYQLVRDILPKKDTWTCQVEGCGFDKNKFVDIDKGIQKSFCEKCLLRNPNAPWDCPRCKAKEIYSKAPGCGDCGLPNPYLGEHGKSALVSPPVQPTEQPATPPTTQETDEGATPNTVTCPDCSTVREAQFPLCANRQCAKSKPSSSEKVASATKRKKSRAKAIANL